MGRTVFLIIIFFSVLSSCKNQQEEDLNLRHLQYVAGNINSDLIQIENEMLNLSSNIQHKIPFGEDVKEWLPKSYHYKDGNLVYKSYKKSGSAVFLPKQFEINDHLKRIVVNSELIDTFFHQSVLNNPLLSQVYFLDTSSFLRIYPYVDILSYVPNSIDLRKFTAYQTAAHKPNLEDNTYWVNRPFADPFGRGWIISCVEPVYYRENFLGIVSGDISLRSLKDKYFSSDTEMILLTDSSGKLICCTKEAATIAGIPALRDFQYFKPVNKNIYTFNNPSLIYHKNKNFREAIKSLIGDSQKESFFLNNKKYTVYKSNIKETNWILFKIIN